MAVAFTENQEESASASESSVPRTRAHPYAVRIVLWMALLGLSMALLKHVSDPNAIRVNVFAHVLLESCRVLVAGCVGYCLWVRYCASGERRTLFATIAICGLMVGLLVHTLTSWHGEPLAVWGSRFLDFWILGAVGFLVIGVGSVRNDSRWYCRTSGLRAIASWIVLSLALLCALYFMPWQHLEKTFPSFGPTHDTIKVSLSYIPINLLTLIALAAALVVFVRQHIQDEDTFSDGVVRCMALAVCSQAALAVSRYEFDIAWWASHFLWLAALLVLLIELAIEIGASHADAKSRIEHLEAVHHISSRISNTLDLRVVMLVLVSDIAEMLSARYASVMLSDEDGEFLATFATHGLTESPLTVSENHGIQGGGRPGFHTGHTARAFREKRVCLVDDVYTDVEFIPWRVLASSNGYAVSLPLVYQDIALGVLDLFFDKHVPINDERIRLFETLGSASAVAIANAQIYDRTLENNETDETPATSHLRLRLAA